VHILNIGDDFIRIRQFVFLPGAFRPESGRLSAHPKLGPESGQKHNIRELSDSLEIGLEPHLFAGKIVD